MNDSFRDFLLIYKSPFYKIVFDKVKMIKIDTSKMGDSYYHFIGKFKFETNSCVFENKNIIKDKDIILKGLKELDDSFGIEFRKKITKKIKKNDKLSKWTFNYVFDFHPKNIVNFDIDYKNNKIELDVYGYGSFT